jgi:hypothetical protein
MRDPNDTYMNYVVPMVVEHVTEFLPLTLIVLIIVATLAIVKARRNRVIAKTGILQRNPKPVSQHQSSQSSDMQHAADMDNPSDITSQTEARIIGELTKRKYSDEEVRERSPPAIDSVVPRELSSKVKYRHARKFARVVFPYTPFCALVCVWLYVGLSSGFKTDFETTIVSLLPLTILLTILVLVYATWKKRGSSPPKIKYPSSAFLRVLFRFRQILPVRHARRQPR